MKRLTALCLLALAVGCGAQQNADVQNVDMPNGTTVRVAGEGQVPGSNPPAMGLRYITAVDPNDATALHEEALKIWHFFRFQAEGKKYAAAVLTPQTPSGNRLVNFTFAKVHGVWYETDKDGKPIVSVPSRLTGAMLPFSWMIGTWNCDFKTAGDKFAASHPTIVVNEANATGTTIDQTYASSWGPGAVLGETEIGYDATRKVWYRRGRQAPDAVENDEASGAYSRDMTYAGYTQTTKLPPLAIRKRVVVNAAGTATTTTTDAKIGNAWKRVAAGTCQRR